MGGSTLLMEAARNPSDSGRRHRQPIRDLPKLLETQFRKHSGLPKWFNPGILLAARFIYGVRTDDLVPIRFARSWGQRPLLLIHGESDTTVPVGQAYELARPRVPRVWPDLAGCRARPGLSERSRELCRDGQHVLRRHI